MKLADGGLVDIEFIAQEGLLLTSGADVLQPETDEALAHLAEAGWISSERSEELQHAWHCQMSLRQILNLAIEGAPDSESFSSGLKSRLARAVGAENFQAVEDELAAHRKRVLRTN